MKMSSKEWKEERQSGGRGVGAEVVEGEVRNRMTPSGSSERVVVLTVLVEHASSVVMLAVVRHRVP